MTSIRELREKRDAYLNTARAITDGAVGDNRDLSEEERADFDRLTAKIDSLNETLKRHNRIADLQHELAQPLNAGIRPDVGGGMREPRPGEVRLLKPSDRLVDIYGRGDIDDVSIGRIVRGIATGDWRGAEVERRFMNEALGSAGAYTVPTPLSARLIDLARAKSVIMRAGAVTVPMESATLKIARLASDPTAAWKVENEAATASEMTFEQVTFTARTLVALCKLSVELFEDGQNIDSVVSDSISQALALELDRVGLVGSGVAPQCQGIYGATNVGTVAVGGAITSYIPFVQAFGAVLAANGTYNTTVINPREWTTLQTLYDGYGRPLYPPTSWLELADPNGRDGLKVSTQVPITLGAGSESIAIVGDFTQMLVGLRTNVVIEASRQAADAESSAFSNMQVWVRAYLRADIQLAHPEHFCVLTGITPA